jgi:hypothetical protein
METNNDKSKHTSGPWFAVNYAGFYKLQTVPGYLDSDDLLNEEEYENAEANAALAKSAPDLLEALEKIYNISLRQECGIAGCTYGDTDYDSQSAAYGFNVAMEIIRNHSKAALLKALAQ